MDEIKKLRDVFKNNVELLDQYIKICEADNAETPENEEQLTSIMNVFMINCVKISELADNM